MAGAHERFPSLVYSPDSSDPLPITDYRYPFPDQRRYGQQFTTTAWYAQTAAEQAAGVTPVNYYYPECTVERYGTNTTPGTSDMTAAVQACVEVCSQYSPWKEMTVMTKCLLTSSITIDRLVDGAAFNEYFIIGSQTGGGFYVSSAISMFSTTIPYTTSPVTQTVNFNSIFLEVNNSSTAAYVLDGPKYLRTLFTDCSFSKIKLLSSATYVQSIYLINSNARRWTGDFMNNGNTNAYDIQVIGGMYEGGGGGFNLKNCNGCKFWTQIEGLTGTALTIPDANGVDISCYLESNGLDIDMRTGNTHGYGVFLHGCIISHAVGTYSVKWGACDACISKGNFHTNNFHDLQSNSNVDINDFAQTSLSNSDAATNIGYREGAGISLTIRGANSASYTTSALTAKYTLSGRRMNIEFTCTLTSTTTNPADQIYIPSIFPLDANFAGGLCGNVEVVGSSINNGISTLYMTNASPARVQSSINVIPANTNGNSWNVRGQISYLTI